MFRAGKMAAVHASKKVLRKEVENRISKLSKLQKEEQSKIVQEKLLALPAFKNSQHISIYLSTEDEICTIGILQEIFKQNKLCFIPRFHGKTMNMVKLESMDDYEKLPLAKWSIKQPVLKEKRQKALETGGLDLVITPDVSFTKTGGRLGRGKGYYDVYFKKLERVQKKSAFKVGLAFREQVVDEVPLDEHDVKLDMILYPN